MTNTIFHYISNRLLMQLAHLLKENALNLTYWEADELKKEIEKREKGLYLKTK